MSPVGLVSRNLVPAKPSVEDFVAVGYDPGIPGHGRQTERCLCRPAAVTR
jgi:hypothetical protein